MDEVARVLAETVTTWESATVACVVAFFVCLARVSRSYFDFRRTQVVEEQFTERRRIDAAAADRSTLAEVRRADEHMPEDSSTTSDSRPGWLPPLGG